MYLCRNYSTIVVQKQLYTKPKTQARKEKIDKLVIIKITNFCYSKGTKNKVKKKKLLQNERKYLQIIFLIRYLHVNI